jgi:quercetin dioxygenase-like cupin family protein
MQPGPPRRVVTGHDEQGTSIVLSDGPPPVTTTVSDGAVFHELWVTSAMPAPLTATEPEPTEGPLLVPPPPNGVKVRINEIPAGAASPMHRTSTVDVGIVLAGEITLILDDSETVLGAGDVIVQRGTDHKWENRSDAVARIAFILVDGVFTDELAGILPAGALEHLMGDPEA